MNSTNTQQYMHCAIKLYNEYDTQRVPANLCARQGSLLSLWCDFGFVIDAAVLVLTEVDVAFGGCLVESAATVRALYVIWKK